MEQRPATYADLEALPEHEVYRLHGAYYMLLAAHAEAERVRLEPFEALELTLGLLWEK